ncbi:hypothetical protein P9173_07565 [Bacillus safensis]|uniref:hypothetical protein n=1 Tax=Bacillus safensis TaxID=561879 RepID=UPI00227EDD57|nr:hypothetical protein [Bacillus safensis]MCY7541620.1 hypothetical protein [Bacillus safensis]MCY7551212.1 hypothetical protein [Bacillus safensis]MCY7645542.1 hypothetical protein [Bacillus safensis]MCY7654993.1 hypothetical protein [Bacillus safensis]MEC3710014.1 hypothetical protein [Bacillus safensis]
MKPIKETSEGQIMWDEKNQKVVFVPRHQMNGSIQEDEAPVIEETEQQHEDDPALVDLTKEELMKLAADRGIEVKPAMNKPTIIELLSAADEV